MSALPKAVQRQIAEANKLAEQIKQGGQPPAGDPPAGDPPAGAPPAAVPPAAPPSEDPWEKKFRVLQGKYNAEVPRLSQQIRERDSEISNLRTQLVTTQALVSSLGQRQASAPAAAPVPAPAASGSRLVKDEEIKNFGPDLYDFIKRSAQEVMPAAPAQPAPQVVAQVKKVEQQVADLGQEVIANKQQKMVALLNEQVPDWEKLNNDQEFLLWLEQTDPYAGVTRQQLMDQAAERFDGPRVVAFFKGYQNEHAAVTPPARQTQQPAAPSAAPVPAGTPVVLDRLVAPGTAKTGAAGAPNDAQKRVYTRADIDSFVARKNAYVIKGKKVPDALVAEEKEILKAGNEGRISG